MDTTHHRSSPEVARMTECIDLKALVLDSAPRRSMLSVCPEPGCTRLTIENLGFTTAARPFTQGWVRDIGERRGS